MLKTVEDNQIIVSMERKDTLQGSQRMLSLGQGVRARLGKNADGKTVVEAFLFDRDKFNESQVDEWINKHDKNLAEALHLVQMKAPEGSFEDTTLRIQRALDDSDTFAGFVMVEFVFSDRVIVTSPGDGTMWEVSYEDNGAEVTFGEPQKVSVEFVKESIERFKRKTSRNNQPNVEFDKEDKLKLKVKEGSFDAEKKQVVVVLIEAGSNFSKKRHYPQKTIQEAAPLFAGLKMYLDHPTEREETEKPERSIREWLSTITESWYEDGKALGKVHIHNDWLLENMQDEVFRSEIGVSINASGRRHLGKIDGVDMEIIDAILQPRSVDWVTEAGARGRVLQLVESQAKEREKKEIQTMDLKEFKTTRKDLYDQVVAEVRESMKGETEAKIKEATDKAVKEALEKESKKGVREAKVREVVSGSKLPEKHQGRFIETFLKEKEDVSDEDLEKTLKEAIIGEIKYLNGLGAGIKIDVDGGQQETGDAIKEATDAITKKAGLEEEKKDK